MDIDLSEELLKTPYISKSETTENKDNPTNGINVKTPGWKPHRLSSLRRIILSKLLLLDKLDNIQRYCPLHCSCGDGCWC